MKEKLRYILFYKPYGVLSQFTLDHPGSRTLAEFGLPPGVYAAGRLDKDSEGLLLLSNDGPFIKQLLDPARGHERTYLAQVEGVPTEEALTQLRNGITIQGYRTKPAKVEIIADPQMSDRIPPIRVRASIPTSWLELRLIEGKNRQVRHMTAAVGFPTLRLIRIVIGAYTLEGLQPGEWRPVARLR